MTTEPLTTTDVADLANQQATDCTFKREYLLQESASLRDESVKRQDRRASYLTFTILTAGTLLSLGTSQESQLALSVFFYPVLALFLAAAQAGTRTPKRERSVGICTNENKTWALPGGKRIVAYAKARSSTSPPPWPG